MERQEEWEALFYISWSRKTLLMGWQPSSDLKEVSREVIWVRAEGQASMKGPERGERQVYSKNSKEGDPIEAMRWKIGGVLSKGVT
jgi:hypothetical protein